MKQVLRRLLIVILAFFCAMGGILLYFHAIGGCVVRNLTTIPCPTCGMTRAAFALLSFRFADAFHSHPLIFVLVPFIMVLSIFYVIKDIKPTDKRYTPVYIITLIVFFVVWIIRLVFFLIP